jgi:tetratricopeptide (TPR) repeat protein
MNFPVRSAAYGLGFGLIAILLHSFTDFGQHLPANAFLSAIFCALLIVMSQRDEMDHVVKKVYLKNVFIKSIIFLFVCGVFVWSLFGANKSRLAEEHRKEIRTIESVLTKTKWKAEGTIYAELISHALAACALEPDNINNLYMLNVYRWRSISQLESPDISNTTVSDSSMALIHDIDENLNLARRFCPTFGPVYTLSGQIEKFILNDNSGVEKIRKGYLLAPCDPTVCFIAGYLDIYEGEYDSCFAKLNRSVELNEGFYRDVVRIYVEDLSKPYEAISLAGDNIGRLKHLIDVFMDTQYIDLAQQCRIKVKGLLEAKCLTLEASASDNASLAKLYQQLNDDESAIEYYFRALTLDYSNLSWRLDLAKLLANTGNVQEAIKQARICLRINPASKEAEKLLADFSISPEGWSKKTQSN